MDTTRTDDKTINADMLYRADELVKLIKAGRSTIWRWVQQGQFPEPIRCGRKFSAWRGRDILAWMENRVSGNN